ncbi:hypothetical protein SARC_09836 [Sphaeroforma arctica JP610]|uniref:Mediator of RNA polymerase II transcription subunit 13 n=1 Tax=Sphaeroforma arctica JP610 TaxID=667725 RepID=A0A0L0FLS9_9EUKA|nr:hypothetical protein SARC_09836 [Sphaeroforma arctica JP610]KNC77710.1 hypothetical protein SARC_09836 [Sphaeroforma arctica JP610]|eukprot:XP_014151612.1 hypothetical protein SARC_09836 [Sphaeroforma arctica JP610]
MRLGKWFLFRDHGGVPLTGNNAVSLTFCLYGSTVCMYVKVERRLLRPIGNTDLDQALQASTRDAPCELPSVLLCPYALPAKLMHSPPVSTSEREMLAKAWSVFFPSLFDVDTGGMLDCEKMPSFVTVTMEDSTMGMLYPTVCVYRAIHMRSSTEDKKLLANVLIGATWRERLVDTMRLTDNSAALLSVPNGTVNTVATDSMNDERQVSINSAGEGYDGCELWSVEARNSIADGAMTKPSATRVPMTTISSLATAACTEQEAATGEHSDTGLVATKVDTEEWDDVTILSSVNTDTSRASSAGGGASAKKRVLDADELVEEVLGSSADLPQAKKVKMEGKNSSLATSTGVKGGVSVDSKSGIVSTQPYASQSLLHANTGSLVNVASPLGAIRMPGVGRGAQVKIDPVFAPPVAIKGEAEEEIVLDSGSRTTSTGTLAVGTATNTAAKTSAAAKAGGPRKKGQLSKKSSLARKSSTGSVMDLSEVTEDDFDFFTEPTPKVRKSTGPGTKADAPGEKGAGSTKTTAAAKGSGPAGSEAKVTTKRTKSLKKLPSTSSNPDVAPSTSVATTATADRIFPFFSKLLDRGKSGVIGNPTRNVAYRAPPLLSTGKAALATVPVKKSSEKEGINLTVQMNKSVTSMLIKHSSRLRNRNKKYYSGQGVACTGVVSKYACSGAIDPPSTINLAYGVVQGLTPVVQSQLRHRPRYIKEPLPKLSTFTTRGYCPLKMKCTVPAILRQDPRRESIAWLKSTKPRPYTFKDGLKRHASSSSSSSESSSDSEGDLTSTKGGPLSQPITFKRDASNISITNTSGTTRAASVATSPAKNGGKTATEDVGGSCDAQLVTVDSVLANLLISATSLNNCGVECSSAGFGGPSPLFDLEADDAAAEGSDGAHSGGVERKGSILTYKRTRIPEVESKFIKALLSVDLDINPNHENECAYDTKHSNTLTSIDSSSRSTPVTPQRRTDPAHGSSKHDSARKRSRISRTPTKSVLATEPSFLENVLQSGEACAPDCEKHASECAACMVCMRLQGLEVIALEAFYNWGEVETDAIAFHLADRYTELPIESFARMYPNQYTTPSACSEANMDNPPDSGFSDSPSDDVVVVDSRLGASDRRRSSSSTPPDENMHQNCFWQKLWRRSLAATTGCLPSVLFQLHSAPKSVTVAPIPESHSNGLATNTAAHLLPISAGVNLTKNISRVLSDTQINGVDPKTVTVSNGTDIAAATTQTQSSSQTEGALTSLSWTKEYTSFDAIQCSASNAAVSSALCTRNKARLSGALSLLPGVVSEIIMSIRASLQLTVSAGGESFEPSNRTGSLMATSSGTMQEDDITSSAVSRRGGDAGGTANSAELGESNVVSPAQNSDTSTRMSIPFTVSGPMSIRGLSALEAPAENTTSIAVAPRLTRVWRDDVMPPSAHNAHTYSDPHKNSTNEDSSPSEYTRTLRVPDVVCRLDDDVISTSPMALQHWDRLSLEPLNSQKTIRYIALCPDNPYLMTRCSAFLQNVSASFRMLRLGSHVPFAVNQQEVSTLFDNCIYKVGMASGPDTKEDPLAPASVRASDGMCAYFNACTFLAAMLSVLVVPKSYDDPCQFYDNKSHYVVYFVNTFAQDTACADISACFTHLLGHLPRTARHLVTMQVIQVEDLVTPGSGGYAGLSNAIGLSKRHALNVYNKCRSMMYARKPIFDNDNNPMIIDPYYLYTPAYRLDDTPQRVKFSADNEMLAAEEIVSRMLHCAYAVSGPWLVSVWTDSVGELLEMKTFYLGSDAHANTHSATSANTNTNTDTSANSGVNSDSGAGNPSGDIPSSDEAKGQTIAMLLAHYAIGLVRRTSMPWRIIIGKLGLLSTGESAIWKDVCTAAGLRAINQSMMDGCNVCSVTGLALQRPTIVSCSVVSLSPEANLQIFGAAHSQGDPSGAADLSTGTDELREKKGFPKMPHKKRRPTTPTGATGPAHGSEGADRPSTTYLSRTHTLSFDRPILSNELAGDFAQPLSTSFLCTVFANAGGSARAKGLAASPAFAAYDVNTELPFSLKLGLVVHGSILSHGRSSDPTYRMLKEVLSEETEAMDADLNHPILKDGKSTTIALMDCIGNQYHNLSWLTATPFSPERTCLLPQHFAVLTRLIGLVCSDSISCAEVDSARAT